MKKEYYAHINQTGQKQTVDEHLSNVAQMSSAFANAFNSSEFGYLAGISHDIGKYSDGFQYRLEGGPKVDHSSAGALECALKGKIFTGMCVAGHHGGLPDYGNDFADQPGDDSFVGRIRKAIASGRSSYSAWNGKLPELPPEPTFSNDNYSCSMWTRMLFSSLVDADFLDTETFMLGNERKVIYDSLQELQNKIDLYTEKWKNPKSELDRVRNKIREDCLKTADNDKGIFSLTVPTGGGKTVSSLSFAVKHAVKHGMNRVIYVIPYTSIIEQNAEVFRIILGSNNVLEHHSEAEFTYSEDLTEEQKRISLAAENWDAPLVVTTAVQFFESLYSNKPSKCRKLHNIANSVIIFDEAQMIPAAHLLPCMAAIGTLVKHFGATVVLCTATQPYVSDILKKYAPVNTICEICTEKKIVFESLKRVMYRDIGSTEINDLAEKLSSHKQVLCIVNTRKTANELYHLLPEEGGYHLSTLMFPEHRKKVLKDIREKLAEGKECRVVSTTLIEAGVDIDFPLVYRELTGVDSIIQAAGRCNREGKRPLEESIVTVFKLKSKVPPILKISIGATTEAMYGKSDLGSTDSVDRYFKSYRDLLGNENIDKTNVVDHLKNGISGCRLPFKTVAQSFHLIDDNTKTVYIVTEDNKDLIDKIISGCADKETYRKAGRFGVNIYENHYNELLSANDIVELPSGCAYLKNVSLYDPNTGLSLKADTGKAEFI